MRAMFLIGATVLSYAIAWAIGIPALVPVLNTLPALPILFLTLRRDEVGRATGLMLLWAATLGVAATTLSFLEPVRSAHLFLNADAYRREMFAWVLTGVGAESNPAQFLPSHLLHASVFCALSVLTGSVLSMPMGAVLMNYMGHFVGTLAMVSRAPLPTALAAWVPWALVRIASFVTLGVVLAGPVQSRLGGFRYNLRDHLAALLVALTGLLFDIVLKAALAPEWQRLLKGLVGW